MQRCAAGAYFLDFSDEEVAFLEVAAHLEFVGGGAATEDAAGEVDGAEREASGEGGGYVD